MKEKLEYHIGLKKGDVGKYVLLPGDPGRTELIAKYFFNVKEIAFNREFRTFSGSIKGYDGKDIKISTTSTGIGCPSTAICVEELINVGVDTFIRVGTAGSLQKNVKLGDIVISTAAVREEGTTRQYVPLSYPAAASWEVVNALVKSAKVHKVRYHKGIVHCKDAFYIEHSKGEKILPQQEYNDMLWKTWIRANVLATSMESAALFIVSSIRNVFAGEVLAIVGATWSGQPVVKKVGIEEAIRVAIEAVKILDAERKSLSV